MLSLFAQALRQIRAVGMIRVTDVNNRGPTIVSGPDRGRRTVHGRLGVLEP